jgi:hypothetical protein
MAREIADEPAKKALCDLADECDAKADALAARPVEGSDSLQ